MNELVKALILAKENRCIETDREYSNLLQIDPSTWSKIKNGKRKAGNDVLSRILVKLPELQKEITAYMKDRGTTGGAKQ